jgi:hypothetical protein
VPAAISETLMKYLLMIYADEKAYAARPAEDQKRSFEAYMAYVEALKKAGAYVGSDRLRPTDTATTVRIVNGKTQVLNGPYVETKEQLGGYFLIDAPDLDAALAWAARCPGAEHGIMEVRPIWTY